jgi:hypothetical protein
MDFLLNKKSWIVPAAATIAAGDEVQTEIVNGAGRYIYSSSDESVLTVDEQGAVTAVAPGVARLSAVAGDGTTITSLEYRIVASKRCAVRIKSVCLLNAPKIH